MIVSVGDLVKVYEKDAYVPDDPWTHPVQLGMLITRLLWEEANGDTDFVGTVVDIKTTKWFGLVKLKQPIYIVKLRMRYRYDNIIYTKKISPHS